MPRLSPALNKEGVVTTTKKSRTRINRMIRVSQIRLIDEAGKQLGAIAVSEGLKKAEEAGLDLVEISPNAKPPVCKIMDYNKFKYDQAKKERQAKKNQHVTHIKEIKMSSKIGEHDYQTKLNHLKKFLGRGDKTKVTMFFRGREMTHIDLGKNVLDRLIKDLVGVGEVEDRPKMEGRQMIMTFHSTKNVTK